MTAPTVTEIRRNGNPVGERVELARYTITAGTASCSASASTDGPSH